jgi:CheY-like chemotaxis protein
VDMSWYRNKERDLVLNWKEAGGPPVTRPSRRGFGTTIIERSIPYDLGGKIEVRYDPKGYSASFVVPNRHVSEPKSFAGPTVKFARPTATHPSTPPPKFLSGHGVLLVEDSLIISLDCEDLLVRLGADHVVTQATAQGALDYLVDGTPSVAILDINLGDRNSFPVADRLLDLGTPFIFASGYGEQASLLSNTAIGLSSRSRIRWRESQRPSPRFLASTPNLSESGAVYAKNLLTLHCVRRRSDDGNRARGLGQTASRYSVWLMMLMMLASKGVRFVCLPVSHGRWVCGTRRLAARLNLRQGSGVCGEAARTRRKRYCDTFVHRRGGRYERLWWPAPL